MRMVTIMRYYIFLLSLFLPIQFAVLSTYSFANGEDPEETVTEEVAVEVEDLGPQIGPNPQRIYCADLWNSIYKSENAQINVTTKGQFDEIVVFTCPDCSLEDHYVKPFLHTEYRGLTGLERLHKCGFVQAEFKGARGIQTIVVPVPSVFPDPNRLECVSDWNAQYEEEQRNITVSTRGELDEIVVFTCEFCASESTFIKPLLENDAEGLTGMRRIKDCGFVEAVFVNTSGSKEIVKEVY